MKNLILLITSVVSEYCCFGQWTEWQQSPLTCGQVCRVRERELVYFLEELFERECNYDHYSCPNHESQSSCVLIGCRKFVNDMPFHCSKISAFLSYIE